MINNKESEIHGCKVNVTWSRKEICTITKSSVRFREIKPLGIEAEWTEYRVPSTAFHLLSLEKKSSSSKSDTWPLSIFMSTSFVTFNNADSGLQLREEIICNHMTLDLRCHHSLCQFRHKLQVAY